MKRGDIFYANLSPTMGSEVAKTRPVLIVRNDINNRVASTITVLPITSKVSKVYPFEVFISKADSGLPQDSKIQAQQIRTISKERLRGDVVGSLSDSVMTLVNLAINLHLGLA